jgi:hypothetical protein
MKMQDIWFLLLISAIVAHLRLVGDSKDFRTARKPVAQQEICKKANHSL